MFFPVVFSILFAVPFVIVFAIIIIRAVHGFKQHSKMQSTIMDTIEKVCTNEVQDKKDLYCDYCGSKMEESSDKCSSCGAKVNKR